MRALFDVRAAGLERWPAPPFQLVANHHNGFDPMLVMAVVPIEPRITWFGPKEADFSRGFKNRVMAFVGGMIPYNPDKTTLTSAVRAVRRVFEADGVLGIFAEGRIGFRETELLSVRGRRGRLRRHLRRPGRAVRHRRLHPPVVPHAASRSASVSPSRPMPSAAARPATRWRPASAMRSPPSCPTDEPRLPRRRPLAFLTDLLNGADDIARRGTGG